MFLYVHIVAVFIIGKQILQAPLCFNVLIHLSCSSSSLIIALPWFLTNGGCALFSAPTTLSGSTDCHSSPVCSSAHSKLISGGGFCPGQWRGRSSHRRNKNILASFLCSFHSVKSSASFFGFPARDVCCIKDKQFVDAVVLILNSCVTNKTLLSSLFGEERRSWSLKGQVHNLYFSSQTTVEHSDRVNSLSKSKVPDIGSSWLGEASMLFVTSPSVSSWKRLPSVWTETCVCVRVRVCGVHACIKAQSSR